MFWAGQVLRVWYRAGVRLVKTPSVAENINFYKPSSFIINLLRPPLFSLPDFPLFCTK
jgi:hypothetical protein